MKIGAIVQARMSSTRLPGKVLKELPYGSGITVLQQVTRRIERSEKLDDVIVATTIDPADDAIVQLCEKEGCRWFRGSVEDVLERYYLAAKENKIDVIVRVTSDCPCIDAEIVDEVIAEHFRSGADYTCSVLERTFPHGLDVEVIGFDALEEAHLKAKDPFDREHVCPYIRISNAQKYKIHNVKAPEKLHAPEIRITLDTEEDYILLCSIFDILYPKDNFFRTEDLVNLFKQKPWLKAINNKIFQKKKHESLSDEIAEAMAILEFQSLNRAKDILAGYL